MKPTKQQRNALKAENKKWPKILAIVPRNEWPITDNCSNRNTVWRSKNFLVQEYQERNNIRLSINRTEMLSTGRWSDNISWDELQEIKRQCGYGDRLAVEIYPEDKNVVNVANMRHLWLPPYDINVGWVRDENISQEN